MTDRSLITTGAIGAALAAICRATPPLAVVLGSIGLTAWLAKADYVVIPVLLLGTAEDLRQTIFAYPTGASDIGSMLQY
jgi:hypothetical protein